MQINGTKSGTKNGTKSGTNGKLKPKEEKIILALIDNPSITFKQLSLKTKIPYRTVSRIVESLKKDGYIQRIGTKTKGYWKIIK